MAQLIVEIIDNELFLFVWFDKDGTSEKVCTKSTYFQVCKPNSVTAEGLLETLQCVLKTLGMRELEKDDDVSL